MRATLITSMSLTAALASGAIAQSQQSTDSQRQSPELQQQSQSGWQDTTVIGYDLDADGKTDVFYTVTRAELDEIRRRAQSQGARYNQNADRSFDDQRPPQQDQWRDRQTQPPQRFRQQRHEPMWDGQPQSVADIPPRTVHGTVKQVREFELAGVEAKQSFARIETEDGNRLVVHLGPTDRIKNIDIGANDEITILAKPGRVNNRMVLTAERIRVDGRTIDVQPPMGERLKVIKGRVIDKRVERFHDVNDESLLVRVRDDIGQTYVVSLGSTSRIDDRDVERGEKIKILAQPTVLDNRPILMAKSVSIDGDTLEIQPLSASDSDVRPHLRRTGN